MINKTEQEERIYLEEIKERLELSLNRVDSRVKQYSEELRQNKEYIYEHQSGMDDADKVAAGQSINRMASTGESTVARKKKLRPTKKTQMKLRQPVLKKLRVQQLLLMKL